ncbi:hypothetical protein D3C78_1281800 [compost metagenome]
MQLPAQAKSAEIAAQVGGAVIGLGLMVVAQQPRHVGPAGFALSGVGQHHDLGDGQRRRHRFGRTGMDFIVQQHPLGVLCKGGRSKHAILVVRVAYCGLSRPGAWLGNRF